MPFGDETTEYKDWRKLERVAKPYDVEFLDKAVRSSGKFGLCYNCYHLSLCQTEFRIKWAICTRFDEGGLFFKLNASEPVTECNGYSKNDSSPSLHDMYKMAWPIDPPRRKAGFLKEKE